MFGNSIATGIRRIKQRTGLVFLLFILNLFLAFLLSIPVYIILGNAVNSSGFGPELASFFDLVLWMDIFETMGPSFASLARQLIWMIPVYFVAKAAIGAGLSYALSDQGKGSFWQGVGQFTGKCVLVGLLFLPILIGIILLTGMVAFVLSSLWQGEIGIFWVYFVIVPVVGVLGLMLLDLMQDYARIAIVVEGSKVFQAWITGLLWPLGYGVSGWIYAFWFLAAALILAIPTLFDLSFVAGTLASIWGLFVLQQVFLVIRAAATVGWIGSEVALFESVRSRETLPDSEEDSEPSEVETDEINDPSPELESDKAGQM